MIKTATKAHIKITNPNKEKLDRLKELNKDRNYTYDPDKKEFMLEVSRASIAHGSKDECCLIHDGSRVIKFLQSPGTTTTSIYEIVTGTETELLDLIDALELDYNPDKDRLLQGDI